MSYVRVRDNETGHHISVPEELYEANASAFSLLKQPGEYPDGSPVETKYKTTVADQASGNSGQSAEKKES